MGHAGMRRVVVTGMGLVTPLGLGVERVWEKLLNGQSGVGAIQSFDVSDLPARIAAQVPLGDKESGLFNADDWVPPKDQRRMDQFIIFAMAAATMAVEDSGWVPEDEEGRERTGCMIGSGIGGLPGITEGAITLQDKGPRRISPFFIPANLINLASGNVSIRYGFKGPIHAVVTACSTGAHAIGDASRLIMLDDADVMVCGGTEAAICRLGLARFGAGPAPSSRVKHRTPGGIGSGGRRSPASVSPALRRPARCLPGSTTTRRGHRVRGTENATVSLWVRAPELS